MFELIRHDIEFCSQVGTVDQIAALKGVPPGKITGREATWQEGKPDYVGPNFGAAWGGTPEEAEQAGLAQRYSEALRRRLQGES